MELSFNTRNYKSTVNKNATIYSNDLNNSQIKIFVSAKVDTIADNKLPVSWEPRDVDLSSDQRKLDVVVTNKSDKDMVLAQIGGGVEGLDITVGDNQIKPGKSTNIEFKWNGEIQKENFARSITFVASTGPDTRFSIPMVVAGTNPTPEKKQVKGEGEAKPAASFRTKTPTVKPSSGDGGH